MNIDAIAIHPTEEQKALQDRLNAVLESALLSDDFVKLVIDTPLDMGREKESFGKRLLRNIGKSPRFTLPTKNI